jgi:hypothetical protein
MNNKVARSDDRPISRRRDARNGIAAESAAIASRQAGIVTDDRIRRAQYQTASAQMTANGIAAQPR